MTAITEYERQRLENIKKNQSLLSSLAIRSIGPSSTIKQKKLNKINSSIKLNPYNKITTPNSAPNSSSKKRGRTSTSSDSISPIKRHATRSAVKLNGTKLLNLDEFENVVHEQQMFKQNEDKKKENTHLDQKLIVESWRIKGVGSKINSDSNLSLTDRLFKSLSNQKGVSTHPKDSDPHQIEVKYCPGNDHDYDKLSTQLNNLNLTSVNKVSQARVYSASFHPDPTKSIIFFGDKLGGVGIYDGLETIINSQNEIKSEDDKPNHIKETKEEEDENEEPEYLKGTSCLIQVHSRYSPVTSIQPHPTHSHLVYTSSYDESIRELNFETKDSIEILNGKQINPDSETLFSNFEFINSGREIWASDNNGGLSHRDLRLPKTDSSRRWCISKKKIGCLSICPNSDDRLAVTSSLSREMRLWDLRALSSLPTDSAIWEIEKKSCLAKYSHQLSCSSAFFNHSGDKIVSTSYDDRIRIWEFDASTRSAWLESTHQSEIQEIVPSYQATHDNQTGRWLSMFRARWCPNPLFPSHFTVGNMKQKLDIYSPKGELLSQLEHPSLTSVPAVTAQHPSSSFLQIAGATAGGKIYLWS